MIAINNLIISFSLTFHSNLSDFNLFDSKFERIFDYLYFRGYHRIEDFIGISYLSPSDLLNNLYFFAFLFDEQLFFTAPAYMHTLMQMKKIFKY